MKKRGSPRPDNPFLLTIAMPQEAELLTARLERRGEVGRRPLWGGRLGRVEVLLVLTGLGLVNAAQALTAALEGLGPVAGVINLGCAGAYEGSGLATGRAAVARELVLADMGIRTQKGFHLLERIGIPLLESPEGRALYNRLSVDQDLSRELAAGGLPRVVFATVAQVSGDPAVAAELEARWGAALEEMEGAAAAQVAAWYGVPFAALRGVSNRAGHRELDVEAGAQAAQRALLAWAGLEESR